MGKQEQEAISLPELFCEDLLIYGVGIFCFDPETHEVKRVDPLDFYNLMKEHKPPQLKEI